MRGKKRGRKKVDRSKEYKKGYHTGWSRAMRKAEGQVPTTRKSKDNFRSEEYQKGLKDGLKAGRRFYGGGKGK